jgi:hypothetical protein
LTLSVLNIQYPQLKIVVRDQMDIYKDKNGYHFGKHIISLEPTENELYPIIEELNKEKPNKYTISEFLSERIFTAVSLFIFIFAFIPFISFYFLDLIPFSNLEYAVSLGDVNAYQKITNVSLFFLGIMSILYFIEMIYYYDLKHTRNTKVREVEDRLNYFKNKQKEIRNKKIMKSKTPIHFRNVPDGRYISEHVKEGILSGLEIGVIVAFFPLIFMSFNTEFIEQNKQGSFNAVHYINDQYIIFQKNEYNNIEKIVFPRNIKVNIKVGNENSFKANWVDTNFPLFKNNFMNKNANHSLNITITEDEHIKGTLYKY